MGCDLHGYVESRQTGAKYWSGFAGKISLARDYTMFGLLAGVSSNAQPLFEPRGIPEELDYSTKQDWLLYICAEEGDNYVTPERAVEFHEQYGCKYEPSEGKPLFIENPDWHTPSWLNEKELEAVFKKHRGFIYHNYTAMLAAMKSLVESGNEVRFVFWFDN